ncbi:type II secretion system F family protein [Micrococcales bacterium 31B]|nr:type II secretion system F family protein [Micrococcales bacterium 31B]
MNGLLVSLVLALGVYCVWSAIWPAPPQSAPRRGSRGVSQRLEELLVQAGWLRHSHKGRGGRVFLGVSLILVILTVLVLFVVTRALNVSLVLAVFAGFLPYWFVRGLARRRIGQRRELWPDVVDNLRSSIRAGLSLPDAVGQLAESGPEPLRGYFAIFAREYRLGGRFGESLDLLKDSFSDPVADRIVEALRMARDVGGTDLGVLLHALSQFLREESRTRAELQARQSWTINAAKLSIAAPWIVLLLIGTRSESLTAFNSATGTAVLAVGALLCVGAYRIMKFIARLPEDERVLR